MEAFWNRLGGVSGGRGSSRGRLGDVLGCLRADLEVFLRRLAASRPIFDRFVGCFLLFSGNVHFAYVFQCFLLSWASLGGVLAASWGGWGWSWRCLGEILGCLGVSWARFGGVFKASGFVSADL